MGEIKCGHCGYQWTARVKYPKKCPVCQHYLKHHIKKLMEIEREKIQDRLKKIKGLVGDGKLHKKEINKLLDD